jgi:hypothetical protein
MKSKSRIGLICFLLLFALGISLIRLYMKIKRLDKDRPYSRASTWSYENHDRQCNSRKDEPSFNPSELFSGEILQRENRNWKSFVSALKRPRHYSGQGIVILG